MARWLALEWDDREARVAVASGRRGEPVLEQAFVVALHPERPNQTPEEIGAKVSAALSARGIGGRLECLVALGRSNLELRHLALPPVPDDELPEIVRFQALREFNTLGEDWPLDFIPTGGSATEPRSVLAAAISPEQVAHINATCTAAGLRPERLILRACGAANLLRRLRPWTERVRLLVDLLTDEADLTVLVNDQVVFLRTARLPGEPGSAEQSKTLAAEIRRTVLAAQNRLDGGKVEAVYVCGSEQAQAALCAQIGQELALPTHVFEPFAGPELGDELRANFPAYPGRFAPLIGILLDQATDTPHVLDFLHPRQKPQPISHRKHYALAGGVAALVALALGVWLYLNSAAEQAEIARLNTELASFKGDLTKVDQMTAKLKALHRWQIDDVVWLDELRDVATRMPSAKEVMLTMWQTKSAQNGCEITLDGVVRQPSDVGTVEQKLRDEKHQVAAKGGEKVDLKDYQWKFRSAINVITDQGKEAQQTKPAAKLSPLKVK